MCDRACARPRGVCAGYLWVGGGAAVVFAVIVIAWFVLDAAMAQGWRAGSGAQGECEAARAGRRVMHARAALLQLTRAGVSSSAARFGGGA